VQVINGIVAAHYGAQLIINAIAEKGYAHVILATGASQFGTQRHTARLSPNQIKC
jgi:hypothetical protein